MGNYYEGNISIGLKKDLPPDIYDLLYIISSENCPNHIPKKFENIPYFQKDKWNGPSFEFGYWLKLNRNENDDNDNDNDLFYDIDSYNHDISDFSEYHIHAYFLRLNFCMKGYKNHMEDFLDFIRPYISDDAPNYLGRIADEDGTYKKDFFIDETEFKNEIKERKPICENCERFSENCFCNNYKFCYAAYQKGINKKEEDE